MKKNQVTFVQPSAIRSVQDYKDMMNNLAQTLTGQSMEISEAEWQREYEKFRTELHKSKPRKATKQKAK